MQPDSQWFDRHEKSDWLPRKPAGSTAEALTLRLPAMKTANFLAKPLWAQLRQIGDSRHAREPSRAPAQALGRSRFWLDLLEQPFPLGLFPRRPKQRRAECDRSREPPEECGIVLDAMQEPRQRFGVTNRKIAGVVAPEQADRAVDTGGEHRYACCDRLRYHVCSAFAHRRQNHRPRTAEQAPHIGARPVAAPDVARI